MRHSAQAAINVTERVDSLGALLRRPYRLLQERVYGMLGASGFPEIRPAHSAVFRHILPEGSRLTTLAEVAGMTKQSMAYLVEHLVEHGHATVKPDPEDGRAKLVQLTAKGQQFIDAALAASQGVEEELSRELGARTLRELRRILAELEILLRESPGIVSPKSETTITQPTAPATLP